MSVQAESEIHPAQRSGVEVSLEPRARTEAVAYLGGNAFTVASETPGGWPDNVPHHWHSDDANTYGKGMDWMEVGECCDDGNFEETRGMAEFDMLYFSGASTVDSAKVEVRVAKLGGLWNQIGPGNFTIQVYTYKGNNDEDISDYNIPATLLTSFGTSGLSFDQALQFDVTSAYNAAVNAGDISFGVRLQAASEPNDAAVVFGNAVLITATNPQQFRINAGLNDAWYFPDTSGQGFFITVFPDLGYVSLAWFTYDTELPPLDATANLGDPGHRWLTAVGPIDGNQALMDIEMTSGGIFDTPSVITRTDPPGSDGTILLIFDSCNSGTIEYDIPSINRQGIVPIQRVANDNIALCEALNAD